MLKAKGPGAITSNSVVERANVTKAALFYYFASVAELLAVAEQRLLSQLKDRYRLGLARAGGSDLNMAHLVDRTATVFLREATEYAGESVANYSVWLRAEDRSALREAIWDATADQHDAWRNVLIRWKPDMGCVAPLFGQAPVSWQAGAYSRYRFSHGGSVPDQERVRIWA